MVALELVKHTNYQVMDALCHLGVLISTITLTRHNFATGSGAYSSLESLDALVHTLEFTKGWSSS